MSNSVTFHRVRVGLTWCGIALTLASMGVSRATYPALAFNVGAIFLHVPDVKTWWGTAGYARWAWVYLVFIGLVSVGISAFPEITNIQVARLEAGLSLALLLQVSVSSVRLWANVPKVMFGLEALGCGLALGAFLLVDRTATLLPEGAQPLVQLAHRLANDDVNANVLGGLAVFFLPIPLVVVLFGTQITRLDLTITHGIMTLLLMCIVVASQSRGAWAAMTVVIGLLTVLRWRRMGCLLVCAVAAIALVIAAQLGFAEVVRLFTFNGVKEGPVNRLEVWSRAFYIIQDFMFTGVGMGGFQPVVNKLYPLVLSPNGVPHAHNIFLQIAVDIGVPGLLAWLVIMVRVMGACWRNLQPAQWSESDREMTFTQRLSAQNLALGILMAQVSLCLHGLVDAPLWGMVRTAPLVWLLWGIALGLSGLRAQKSQAVQKITTPIIASVE